MGSSSSKPQYYYPYPQTIQPVSAGYPYPAEGQGQFGYYIQQVGSDPNQVQAVPGYYYHPGDTRVRRRTTHKKQSSPSTIPPSQSQQNDQEPSSASADEPPATTAPLAEPAIEPLPPAPPEAPAEATADADKANDSTPQDAEPSTPVAKSELTNPLPSLPSNTLDTYPYRHVRRTQTSGATSTVGYYTAPIASVAYKPHLRSQYRPHKGKDPTLRLPRPHEELIKDVKTRSTRRGPFKLLRSLTMQTLSGDKRNKSSRLPVYPNGTSYAYPYAPSRGPIPAFPPASLDPPIPTGPPITVRLHSPLNPTSPHKILYKKKLYPTAAHLFEAHKFLKHEPELAERLRTCSNNALEMDALSRAFERDGLVRRDWALVWRDKMDDVLYLKFVQHPDLRAELMATGYSPLLDGNEPRRPDVETEGVNELGKALVRLRERLRREGAR